MFIQKKIHYSEIIRFRCTILQKYSLRIDRKTYAGHVWYGIAKYPVHRYNLLDNRFQPL